MGQYVMEAAPCSIEDIEARWDYTAGRPLAPPWLVGAPGGHIEPQFEFRPPHLAVCPFATADLAQVDNSAELPLLLLGIVKDPEELADGHFPGDAPGAILENPALSCAAAVSTPREAKGDVKITEPFQ